MNTLDFSILKILRAKKGLSSGELAQKAGITRTTIAKMENGQGNPTVETIAALAKVFQMATSELIRLAEKDGPEVAGVEEFEDKFFSGYRNRFSNFETYYLNIKAGTTSEFSPQWHDITHEVCMVLRGNLTLQIASETWDLRAGMALRFKALHSHSIQAHNDAEIIMIHYQRM